MAQLSFPWPDTTDPGPQVGDGRPYTATEWAQLFELVYSMGSTSQGVLSGVWNELEVTVTGANALSVDTGAAFVRGKYYQNTSAIALTPPSASAGTTRYDYVILRADWDGSGGSQYTVRCTYKQGTAGGPPSLTQVENSVWEIALYSYRIDDSGNIDQLTDLRVYCTFATYIGPDQIQTKTRRVLLPLHGRDAASPWEDYRGKQFTPGYDEWGSFAWIIPEDYAGGGLKFSAEYMRLADSGGNNIRARIYFSSEVFGDAVPDDIDYQETLTLSQSYTRYKTTQQTLTGTRVQKGALVTGQVYRLGTATEDTCGAIVVSTGLEVEYLAEY